MASKWRWRFFSTVFVLAPIEQNPGRSGVQSIEHALHELEADVADLLEAFKPEF